MRKRTGLRNRYRSGRGTYSLKGKGRLADKYGTFQNGKRTADDRIAGHIVTSPPPEEK